MILQIVQVIVGASTRLFLIAPPDVASSLTDETGFLRVRPPGLTTVYVVAAFALACLWGPAGIGCWAGHGGRDADRRDPEPQPQHAARARAGALRRRADRAAEAPLRRAGRDARLALSGFVLLAQGSAVGSNAVVSRFASITNYSELQRRRSTTATTRTASPCRRIRAHPVGGLGWGPPYGAVLLSFDDGFVVKASLLHARAVPLDLDAGRPHRLLALIAAWPRHLERRALVPSAAWKDDAWLGAGVVVSVVAMAASSNVAIYLTPPDRPCPSSACSRWRR